MVSEFSQTSGLPQPPAAIYMSPRGTVSAEAAALPTSTPGGLFSRTPSFPAGVKSHNSGTEYFPSSKAPAPSQNAQKKSFAIPSGETISVEDLQQILQAGAQVLFIDVRERESFDDGHLNAQFIICIEPSILRDTDTTSDSLRGRMAINADAELDLFDRRDEFDLVVYYDDDATSVPKYVSEHNKKNSLVVLKRVLFFFSIDKKTDPKLLEGGIGSWLDMFGPQCLVASGDQPRPPRQLPKRPGTGRGQVKYVPKNMNEAELEHLKDKLGSAPQFVRNTEEFLIKYPDVPAGPQSMTGQLPSPPPSTNKPLTRPPVPVYPGISDIPAPPTRPAPTVAKPSNTGFKPGEDPSTPATTRGVSTVKGPKKMTGLFNPGNWCFANSSVQSLRMSPGFGPELSKKEWEGTWKIPKLPDEKSEHPRIMARIVANLFHWLNEGNFNEMKASTLMVSTYLLFSTCPR